MGVYIRGIEMPLNCGECFACKAELSQEKKVIYVCCFTREEYVSDENRVETDCPLVQVPPHGALIDRDDFFATCPELVDGYKTITDDLVVLPAEEGET